MRRTGRCQKSSSSDFQTLTQRRGDSSLLCGELWSFDDAFLDSWEIKIKELFNWNHIFFSLISLTKVWIFIVKNVKLNNVLLYSSWIKRCMTLTQSRNMWEHFWKSAIVYYFFFAACCPFIVRFEPWEELSKWYLCYLFGGLLSSCLCPINPGHWRLVTQINTQISVKLQEYKLLFSPHSTPAPLSWRCKKLMNIFVDIIKFS